jgi:dienelactone hydrolase
MRCAASLLLLVAASQALAQPATDTFGLEAGEHAVGFRLLEDEDASRVVTGGVRGAPHARPIRTYLWYPAEAAGRAQPLRFGRYAQLTDDDVWPAEISGELRERLKYANGPLARSMSAADYAALLARSMRAVENAEPLAGPFPLLVIGLGLYYESPITFASTAEYLAGRGFVVATAPLVGTQIAIGRLTVPDLETQIRDLEFVIARARQHSFVDAERLGVMGFDQGGMAGVVLTMRNRDVDAFVSLDSGIQYPHESGLPRSSPSYDALALRVPWLHAANRGDGPPPAADPKSLFDEAVHSDRSWLRTPSLGHADFTSYALVEGRGAAASYWEPATPLRAAGHRALAQYVEHFFAAHLRANAASAAFLAQDARTAFPDAGMTIEHRAPTAAPITFDEAVQKIVHGRAGEATDELRTLAAASPNDPLLTEFNLVRLCVSLLYTWNLAKETLPLAELTLERYPTSPNAKTLVGETQAMLGNYAAAIALYEELLVQFPGNAGIQARLEALRSRR